MQGQGQRQGVQRQGVQGQRQRQGVQGQVWYDAGVERGTAYSTQVPVRCLIRKAICAI